MPLLSVVAVPPPLLNVINTPKIPVLDAVFTLPDIVTFGCPACVTVTSLGLPVAPAAVTLMVAMRVGVAVLAV